MRPVRAERSRGDQTLMPFEGDEGRSPIWRRGSTRAISTKRRWKAWPRPAPSRLPGARAGDRFRGDRADARDRQPWRYGESLGPERAVRRDRGAAAPRARRAMGGVREAAARVRRDFVAWR